jgi:hypothetical protein
MLFVVSIASTETNETGGTLAFIITYVSKTTHRKYSDCKRKRTAARQIYISIPMNQTAVSNTICELQQKNLLNLHSKQTRDNC